MIDTTTEIQAPEVNAPEINDGLDDILGEASSLLENDVLDTDDTNDDNDAARSDVDSASEDKSSEGTDTSGQKPADRRGPNGNKHTVQNRINSFKRLAAESDERAEIFRNERDSLSRENQELQSRIKEVETLISDLQRQQASMRSNQSFDTSGQGFGMESNNGFPNFTNENAKPPTYAENDPNRPLTYADLERIRGEDLKKVEQARAQQTKEDQFRSLLAGWSPHLEKAKTAHNAELVHSMFKKTLSEAAELARRGETGLRHAVEIIKDFEHPIETLTALRCMPGYQKMTPAQISVNVSRLNRGILDRKRLPSKAKPITEIKSGTPPARGNLTYEDYCARELANKRG